MQDDDVRRISSWHCSHKLVLSERSSVAQPTGKVGVVLGDVGHRSSFVQQLFDLEDVGAGSLMSVGVFGLVVLGLCKRGVISTSGVQFSAVSYAVYSWASGDFGVNVVAEHFFEGDESYWMFKFGVSLEVLIAGCISTLELVACIRNFGRCLCEVESKLYIVMTQRPHPTTVFWCMFFFFCHMVLWLPPARRIVPRISVTGALLVPGSYRGCLTPLFRVSMFICGST